MNHLLVKSLHLIFMVTWFAGLFYIVRLFIYHREILEKKISFASSLDLLKLMERRLWFAITWPSAILLTFFGILTLIPYLPITEHPWLIVKLFFVLLLWIYHLYCHRIFRQLKCDQCTLSSQQLRFFNEIPTFFLFMIIFLAVFRNLSSASYFAAFAIVLIILLFVAITFYKRLRMKKLSLLFFIFMSISGEASMTTNAYTDKTKQFFNQLNASTMNLVATFYHPNIHFKDPLGEINGLAAMTQYYEKLYQNVKSIEFQFRDPSEIDRKVFAPWKMILHAPKLKSDGPVVVEGISEIHFDAETGLAIFHQDYFDMNAFIYEHIPLLGRITRLVNKNLKH